MDATHAQGILINAAGLLYGCLGFSLSVIAALFNLFYRQAKVPSELIMALPSPSGPIEPRARRPPNRSLSDKPIQISPRTIQFQSERVKPQSSSEKKDVIFQSPPSSPVKALPTTGSAKAPELKAEKKIRRFCHQRSHSIPAILVDNFDSVEYITWNSADSVEAEPRPPLYSLDLPPPSAAKTNNASTPSLCDTKSLPRLFTPKLWGKDKKPKPLKRCKSSPQLYTAPFLPIPVPPTDQLTVINSENLPEVTLKKTKSWKTLRKPRSGTILEKPTPKPEPRKAEKKKSQPLRTHPYEAPYFAPPPIPAMPVHITFKSDLTSSEYSSSRDSSPKSSLDRKLSRRFSKS